MGNFISYELLPIVFNMSVTASVVILFVLLARLLLKKAPKIFSYALWAVVLFRLLCPVSITTGFSLLGLFDAPVTETTTHTTAVEYIPQDVVHTPAPEVKLPVPGINQSVNELLPQGDEQTAADPMEASVTLATLVWLAGIGVLAAYSVVSLLRLRGRLVGAVPLRDNIYLADYIETPFVMGILRPKIYLPSSLSEQEQGYIILHERHHIRRGDHNLVYNAVVNDNLDFYGYHNSYEEAIYDWYVTENGLDLPLYVKDLTVGGEPVPAHRYDGDGWYIYIPVSGWKQARVTGDNEDYTWGWSSAYDTGAYLIVAYFGPEVAASLRGSNPHMKPLDNENRVWEQQGDDYARRYFTDTPDGGCWRVSVLVPSGSTKDPGELEALYAMAESFTVDSRFQGFSEPLLTLDDVLALSEKGEALTWADFEPYSYIEKGNGDNLYIRIYPISGTGLAVSIGGGPLTDPPGYINLADSDEYIDIRTGDVAAFIRSHQSGESSAEPLTAEELAWFNDWFESLVKDKQGNDIGVNARCCFLTSFYDGVTELNFEEFMRYFPGDGSRTSEAEFEALRGVDGWPFDWVESLEKMPVPVHKYPKRLVDLILSEYAGVSTADLNTEGVAYLPEYDAYYNYTSDFGPGMFVCTRGERDGDIIRLYSVNGTDLLTLRQVDDTSYQIVSLQRLESPVG